MTVGEVSPPDLAAQAGRAGVLLNTGPFVIHLQTPLPLVVEAVRFLYHDFALDEDGGLADFHVRVAQPAGLRRWWRPQAVVQFDGLMPFAPLPLAMAVPMLEWSLNWCAATYAHHYVMMHAGVVERSGRALILPGAPRSGKSTLCAALIHRGWRLLSDEFALLRPEDARLAPWPRPVSLKDGAIEVIRAFVAGAPIGPPVGDTLKGTVAHMRPPSDSVERARETARAAWIIFPTYQAGASTRLAPLPKSRAFFRLADNSHNYDSMGLAGFETLASVIETCDAYEFTYSDLDEAVTLFDSLEPPGAPDAQGS